MRQMRACCLLVIAAGSSSNYAQPAAHVPRTSGGGEVSPSVVVTFDAYGDARGANPLSGPWTLDLMVLWRGSPGWLATRPAQSGTNVLSVGSGSDRTHTVWVHGQKLELRVDAKTNTALIQGLEVPLNGVNVLLIDDVDKPVVKVAGVHWVEPEFPPFGEDPVETLLKRSPMLLEFAQRQRR